MMNVVHNIHGAGASGYIDCFINEYKNATAYGQPYKKINLIIGGSPMRESFRVEPINIAVISVGELLAEKMRTTTEFVKRGDWRAHEKEVIDNYILKNPDLENVRRTVFKYHPAAWLKDGYAQGLTEESIISLYNRFGEDGTTFHFIWVRPEDIKKRLDTEEKLNDKFPEGINKDIITKVNCSKLIYSITPEKKRFVPVLSFYEKPDLDRFCDEKSAVFETENEEGTFTFIVDPSNLKRYRDVTWDTWGEAPSINPFESLP